MADEARPGGPRAKSRGRLGWQLAVSAVCLLGGVLFGTAHSFANGKDIHPRTVELSGLLGDAQNRVNAAEATATRLQAQIDDAAGLDVSPQVEKVRQSASGLDAVVGLTPVTGPGLQVTLTDAPRDANGNYPSGVNPDDLVVHQQDVQSLVNGLWAGGAEAMTIMGQRVIASSAVRCVGNTLLLQGRAYSPPFIVAAIGPASKMIDAIEAERGVILFRQYVTKFNLGFQIESIDEMTLPGYDGLVRLTAAQQQPQ
jgi:uncharacterized protein YlxW (UPF0749 family)